MVFLEKGETARAMKCFEEAVKSQPTYYEKAHDNLQLAKRALSRLPYTSNNVLLGNVEEIVSKSLSEIRLIYYGCAGFGRIFRSFSFNSPTIRLKRSKYLTQTSTPSQRSLIS